MKKYGLLAAGIVLVIGLVWVGVERHGLQKGAHIDSQQSQRRWRPALPRRRLLLY